MAAEQTFVFPEAPSGSDCSDEENELLNEDGVGHIRNDPRYKVTPSTTKTNSKTPPKGTLVEKEEPLDRGQKEELQETIEILREKRELLLKRRAIVYQLMAISAIVMLHGMSFMPYFWNNSLMNISVLSEQTLTLWCVLLAYGASCFYTPSFLYRVSMRWTMACGCLIAAIFSVGRFYPSSLVLVPCSVVMGSSLGPFYCAASRQIARLANLYEGYQGSQYKDSVITFTAVFFACLCFSPIWVSFLHVILFNVTSDAIADPQAFILPDGDCGFNYLWNLFFEFGQRNGLAPELHTALQPQLVSCLICTLGGVILSITSLRDIPFPRYENTLIIKEKVTEEVKQVSKQVRDSNLLLLFPIYMCLGFLETFCYTVYVQAFVYCNIGVDQIYNATLCSSVCALVTCLIMTYAMHHVSRQKVTLPAYIVAVVLLVSLILLPNMREAVYYIFAALLGMVVVVLNFQVHGLTSLEFTENLEVSHSLLCFGKVLSYLTTFCLVRYHGDNSTVTGCVIGTCIIAFLCHLILEIRLSLGNRDEQQSNTSGAYMLLSDAQWIPSMDPKSVKQDQTKHLLGRIPEVHKGPTPPE